MDILEPYHKILSSLLRYGEFRLGLEIFHDFLLVMVALLLSLGCLHALYFAGHTTVLYRRKAPVDGWNRRFVGALLALLIIIFVVIAGLQLLLDGYK